MRHSLVPAFGERGRQLVCVGGECWKRHINPALASKTCSHLLYVHVYPSQQLACDTVSSQTTAKVGMLFMKTADGGAKFCFRSSDSDAPSISQMMHRARDCGNAIWIFYSLCDKYRPSLETIVAYFLCHRKRSKSLSLDWLDNDNSRSSRLMND